jgi:hypothetical protein
MELFGEIGLYISYVLSALALIGMLVGISLSVAQGWKEGGMYAIIGVVAIIAFLGVGYLLSSSDVTKSLLDQGLTTVSGYKWSSAGIITVYILSAIAGLLLVVDIVKGFVDGN